MANLWDGLQRSGGKAWPLESPKFNKVRGLQGQSWENLTFPSLNSSFNQSYEGWVGKQTGRKVRKVGVTATPADNGQLVGELDCHSQAALPWSCTAKQP